MNPYLKDLAERITATFVGAFLSVWVVTDLSSAKTAAVAGAAAVVSLIKGLLAKQVGNSSTASLTI